MPAERLAETHPVAISGRELRVAAATVVIFVIFDRAAARLGSTRGEAGALVCLLVLALTLRVERWIARTPVNALLAVVGLGVPAPRAVVVAGLLGIALVACLPLLAAIFGTTLEIRSGAAVLALGIFLQAGIAEETLFRGFLYRHARERRSFWRASLYAAVPFVAAHLLLFVTLEPAVALAALLVSVSLTFPLARIFDYAGGSIWPGAIVHAVVQGAIKLVEPAGEALALTLSWMAVAAVAPWLVFLLPQRRA